MDTCKVCSVCGEERPLSDFTKRNAESEKLRAICRNCKNKSLRDWRQSNLEWSREYRNSWRRKNLQKCKDSDRKRYEKNREKILEYNKSEEGRAVIANQGLKRRYGIDMRRYHEMLAEQSYVCAICNMPPRLGEVLMVDHNHETKKVRGLLCNSCNALLGLAKDNPEILEKARGYLEFNDTKYV